MFVTLLKQDWKSQNTGCDSANSNLTPEQVIQIRETCILGDKEFGAKALAKIHGISDVARAPHCRR